MNPIKHVAIIMDGNGRWGTNKGKTRNFGHKQGLKTVEKIIKGRKALFSKNYSSAKRVQALSSKGEFEKAKSLMIEMSENYKVLSELFPDPVHSMIILNKQHK